MADPARLLVARIAKPLALVAALALSASPAVANQGLVARDGTLGGGALDVAAGIDPLGQPADYLITPDLGEQRGGNLFHSFARFGIGAGETATFTGPDPLGGPQSVANIISRVTGGSVSQLDGTLRSTIPGADLWLINPNGLVFGAGAQLDVPGSFHAATADSLAFDDAGLVRFFADTARPSVLAIAEPRAFGFLGSAASGAPSLRALGSALAVPAGETLSLVARDELALDGARLTAENGRVNLAAVASAGDVVLGDLSASEPLDVGSFSTLGEITLAQQSRTDASGAAPGAIFIRGGHVVVEGSQLLAEQHGDASAPGGRIDVLARESLDVDGGLLSVSTDSAGDAGTIRLTGGDVALHDGPGFVDLVADHPLSPRNAPHATEVGVSAETSSSGAGGTIAIDAGALTATRGVSVSARTYGPAATGDAGGIEITAHSLDLSARSDISAGAWDSQGNAGVIDIDVRDGLRADALDHYAFIWTTSVARFGAVTLRTVPGAPGAIEIDAGLVELLNGATIQSACFGCASKRDDPGRPLGAGTIAIRADRMRVEGFTPANGFYAGNPSFVLTNAEGGAGDAGSISVLVTGELELLDSAFIGAGAFYGGRNAGEVFVQADSLRIRGVADSNVASPGLYAGSGQDSTGDAGRVQVTARSVRIELHGLINVSSLSGDAGAIEISASESIYVTNEGGGAFVLGDAVLNRPFTGIVSASAGGGNGGSVRLEAPDITVTDGAIVATSTVFGGGDAGDVMLRGDRIRILNGSFVDSTSVARPPDGYPSGDAGSVTLEASESIEVVGHRPDPDPLAVRQLSRVGSASIGSGRAGTVALTAPLIRIDGGTVSTTAVVGPSKPGSAGSEGVEGGSISIDAEHVLVTNGGRIEASTGIAGRGGSIDVAASESIVIEGAADGINSGIVSLTGAAGAGGDVTLRAPRIEVRNGGVVSARSGPANAELRRTSPFARNANTDATGDAGRLTLIADELLLSGGTLETDVELADADGGDIAIVVRDRVHLIDGVTTASVNDGTGGNITIDPVFVILQDGSRIETRAGGGTGGTIRITAENVFQFPGTVISADADPDKLGIDGTVEIHSPDVDLSGALTALPASFLDASSLMRERCAARRTGERAGSFTVRGVGGVAAEPDAPLMAGVTAQGPHALGVAAANAAGAADAPPAPSAALDPLAGARR